MSEKIFIQNRTNRVILKLNFDSWIQHTRNQSSQYFIKILFCPLLFKNLFKETWSLDQCRGNTELEMYPCDRPAWLTFKKFDNIFKKSQKLWSTVFTMEKHNREFLDVSAGSIDCIVSLSLETHAGKSTYFNQSRRRLCIVLSPRLDSMGDSNLNIMTSKIALNPKS